MKYKSFSVAASLVVLLVGGVSAAVTGTEQISLTRDLQIPGGTLPPGKYTIEVEDSMRDRAIIRIAGAKTDQHFLLLAVPNSKLTAKAGRGIILFHSADSAKSTLRAWKCGSCSSSLELVYPKLEAVKITGESGQSVLAVDPASDKLPAELSADDMKVVTLWLLSPERVDAGHRGVGLKAAKYSAPTAEGKQGETLSATRRNLPKTASNTYWFAALGALSLVLSLIARGTQRTRRAECIR